MSLQVICIILNIYIIFLTNQFYCYQLDLDFNCETKHITNNYFTIKYNVTIFNELQMRSCGITEIDENAYGDFTELKSLDLSHNDITYLPPNVFSSLVSLEELRLKSNKLNNLDAKLFKNLNELILLDLHSNNIEKIDKNLFSNLKKLKTLYLYSNRIFGIELGTFANNLQLQYIDLYGNQISEIKNGVFANLINLDKLYITYNHIQSIETHAFPVNLKELFLAHNRLQYIDHKIITNLKKLQYLTLFGNPWNCDIKLKKLIDACKNINLVVHHTYTLPTCAKPDSLANRKWDGSLTDSDFSSISIKIEPTATLSKGDAVTLSCRTNPDISIGSTKKLSWVYEENTSVVNSLEADGRPTSFNYMTDKDGVVSSSITIHSVQESDARLYKCVLYIAGEVLDEKSEKLIIH